MQAGNEFRQDLYYRLKSHHINIPPLRERQSDIPYLVGQFATQAAAELGKKRPALPRELFTLLKNYHFPGNVRELRGIMFDAVSLHTSGILSLDSVRKQIAARPPDKSAERTPGNRSSDDDLVLFPGRFPTLGEVEETVIEEALKRAEGNQTIAAELLGISRRALNNRLRRKDSS
jgi:DNA-binding NtrC family response regulator